MSKRLFIPFISCVLTTLTTMPSFFGTPKEQAFNAINESNFSTIISLNRNNPSLFSRHLQTLTALAKETAQQRNDDYQQAINQNKIINPQDIAIGTALLAPSIPASYYAGRLFLNQIRALSTAAHEKEILIFMCTAATLSLGTLITGTALVASATGIYYGVKKLENGLNYQNNLLKKKIDAKNIQDFIGKEKQS